MNTSVRRKVTEGETFGRTPKVVEPIRPREEEVRAAESICTPRETRSGIVRGHHQLVRIGRQNERDEGGSHLTKTRSAALTRAQTFPAQ